jgi:hypothetical protein
MGCVVRIKVWFGRVIYSPNTVIFLICLIVLLSFLGVVVETAVESTCIDCGWKGSETEHHFLDGWHVCPSCHQAEFLVSGDELDEMNELEGATF